MDVSDNPIADQLYKDVFFSSPLGIYTLDGEGIITSFNPKMAELSGDKPENAIGLNALHLESYKKVGLDELFRKGIAGQSFEVEVAYESHLANKKTVRRYRGMPIEDKGIIGQSRLLLIVEDITETKRIEAQLQSAAQFTAENTNPLLRVAKDGAVLLANNAAHTVAGGQQQTILAGELLQAVVDSINNDTKVSIDITSEDRTFLFEVVPNTAKQYANLYGRDVTEERKTQQIKDHFISVTSHELRTPMTVIRGYVELMLQGRVGAIDEKQQEYLQKILSSVKGLIEFVNNTLDLSKLESGEMKVTVEAAPLNPSIATVVDNLQQLYNEAGVILAYTPTDSIVMIDKTQFERVMTNLLGNSLKFTQPGGKVTVEVSSDETYATIAVKDTGVGISEDDQKLLFQKYAQIENKWVSKMRGTGLGLVISKDIVEKMQGKIWVESKLDMGSTFFVSLPLAPHV